MPTPGILTVALTAQRRRLDGVVVPAANAAEASLVEGLEVIGAPTLVEVAGFLRGTWKPEPPRGPEPGDAAERGVDLSDVRGQARARRALEVAAAGGHNLMMVGSPGSGKTMLARRFATILPSLTPSEALEVTQLHSVAGLLGGLGLVRERPFRSPHHSVSMAGLLGGGSAGLMRPGEVSLAHRGVLFLDEFNEFRRDAIESLRQPLEDGRVVVTRAHGAVEFPARFTLIAAANPCPCGYEGDTLRVCECPPQRAQAYRQKLSGPLLDRVDLRLEVPRLSPAELLGEPAGEPSERVRERVEEARQRQSVRLGERFRCNADVPGHLVRRYVSLSSDASELLQRAAGALGLTGRGFDRALRVARTIADLAGAERVDASHLAEALSYRTEEREVARV